MSPASAGLQCGKSIMASPMSRICSLLLMVAGCIACGLGASRQHAVFLGKSRLVTVPTDADGDQKVRIRPLLVDSALREYTAGPLHLVTEQLFVVRRARLLNDSLPGETAKSTPWVWRLEGWMSVDRRTGHIAQLNLPAFDPESSQASWYRDYAAYCGSSDDGRKSYMVVFQLGRRKPILKKEFAGGSCPEPRWERRPSRVTFNIAGEQNSFVVHARSADPESESNSEEGPQ